MEFKKHRRIRRSSAFLSMSEARTGTGRWPYACIQEEWIPRIERNGASRSVLVARYERSNCPSRSRRETPKERRSSRGIFPFARRRKHFPSPSPEEGRRRKTRTIATKVANGQSCAKTRRIEEEDLLLLRASGRVVTRARRRDAGGGEQACLSRNIFLSYHESSVRSSRVASSFARCERLAWR